MRYGAKNTKPLSSFFIRNYRLFPQLFNLSYKMHYHNEKQYYIDLKVKLVYMRFVLYPQLYYDFRAVDLHFYYINNILSIKKRKSGEHLECITDYMTHKFFVGKSCNLQVTYEKLRKAYETEPQCI